jgi:hypothetical protein
MRDQILLQAAKQRRLYKQVRDHVLGTYGSISHTPKSVNGTTPVSAQPGNGYKHASVDKTNGSRHAPAEKALRHTAEEEFNGQKYQASHGEIHLPDGQVPAAVVAYTNGKGHTAMDSHAPNGHNPSTSWNLNEPSHTAKRVNGHIPTVMEHTTRHASTAAEYRYGNGIMPHAVVTVSSQDSPGAPSPAGGGSKSRTAYPRLMPLPRRELPAALNGSSQTGQGR